jgi:4-amino-4-deoxy-L-arabinose transferase-like glycosyltransferase
MIVQKSLGIVKAELVLVGVEFGSAAWVLYDANQRRIPRVFRWAGGTLLLWVLVFPWYLARRQKPQATCPFVESQAGPLVRILLIALAASLIMAIILTALQGPVK